MKRAHFRSLHDIASSRIANFLDGCRVLLALMLALGSASVLAQAATDYPNHPIKMLVGFAPGTSTEIIARAVASRLQTVLGQSIFVESRAGASGMLAQQATSASAPDGYTILFTAAGPMGVGPGLRAKLPYDPMNDYEFVGGVLSLPMVLVVRADSPMKSVRQFVALAKQKPGEISYGSLGPGTTSHMAMELLSATASMKLIHVPYKGSAGVLTDLLGGRIDVMFDTPVSALPMMQDGRTIAIAVGSRQRASVLPQVPTIEESGYPGFSATSWMCVLAPKGTPPRIVSRLSDALREVLDMPDMRKYLADQQAEPMPMSSAELRTFIKAEIDKWTQTARNAGLREE